jgi:starch phosphorylase
VHAIRRFTVRPVLPEPLRPLSELAINLRWSWHGPTQDLFASADPDGWDAAGHDPVRLLGSLSVGRLAALASDEGFLRRLAEAADDLNAYLTGDRWYQESVGEEVGPRAIGYFSPEFGITSVLPQYSGGLGILAGDHLKSASDLGVPLVGVGLFYRHGYFRQSLSRAGWQEETYPVNDPDGLPLTLLREEDGSVPHVSIDLPGGRRLVARVWIAQVGRVPLLLLDSEKALNHDLGIDVTDRLYGGGSEHRLLQELLLGVGGVRALRLYSRITGAPDPEIFHTNEGHAGFLGLERIRELVQDGGLDFATALEVVRGGTLFTTHTPVPAGIDRFSSELVGQHFGGDVGVPGVPVHEVLALGAEDYPGGDPTKFNMAVMGLRLAKRANGVSRLHGAVSRGMFAGLWPAFDAAEVPISSITNGVHAPTWMAREMIDLLPSAPDSFESVDSVDSTALWQTKRLLRERLVLEVRRRLRESWLQRGAASSELGWVDSVLDPDVLTIGFARRVPSYKRLTLMLSDPDRLRSLLLHPTRPIQLVIAGKSHPADDGGKKLIAELVRFADAADVRHRIVFLPDYDIAMAQPLYPGCDVWLNNPLRPYEACGTSGMKSALNGGLNLSILDGWWDEWFDGSNGWAIPSADGVEDTDRRDDIEAQALYDLVESEVAARFYDVDGDGLPTRWLEMMRHTLRSLGPKVLADRMLSDYVHELYVPTVAAARALSDVDLAADLAKWKMRVRASWPDVRVDYADAEGISESPEVGSVLPVEVWVELGQLGVDDVDVQVVHGRVDDDDTLTESSVTSLDAGTQLEGGRHRFAGEVVLDRTGPFGWTVRVLPRHDLLANPAETRLIRLPAELVS